MTRTIEITISPTGQSKLETKGFAGPSCRDASRFLEEALGERASEQPTTEFHQAERAEESARQST